MASQSSIGKKPLPKLGYMVTSLNITQFKKDLKNKRANYGPAGEALITGIAYDSSLELRRENFLDRVQMNDGTIVETTRAWNKTAEAERLERNRVKVSNNKEHDKFKGPLWADLHEVISNPLLDRIKSDDKTKYLEAQLTLDYRTLMQQMETACQGLNRNRIQTLEEDYNKYFQGQQRFESFAVKHEEKHDSLVTAGKKITDNEFSVHLRDHTNVVFGKAACPEAYNTSADSPQFPTYTALRDKYWEAAQADQNIQQQQPKDKDVKEGNGKKNDNREKGNPNKKRQVAPEDQVDALAVMSAKVDKLTELLKAKSQNTAKKQKVEPGHYGTSPKPDTAAEYQAPCWNCDIAGHPYFKCTSERVVCSKCKQKGHCAKYHDEWKSHTDRFAAEKAERAKNRAPIKKGNSVRVVEELPLEEECAGLQRAGLGVCGPAYRARRSAARDGERSTAFVHERCHRNRAYLQPHSAASTCGRSRNARR